MDFRRTLEAATTALAAEGIRFALIGGVAMAALGAPRATGGIDLLVDGDRADEVDRILRGLGYSVLHRSADAANYVPGDTSLCRVDLLYALRVPSRGMLARATPHAIHGVAAVPVVQPEDVIGLKVQASSNDPCRLVLDLADIERLLIARPGIDFARVREYFVLFDRAGRAGCVVGGARPRMTPEERGALLEEARDPARRAAFGRGLTQPAPGTRRTRARSVSISTSSPSSGRCSDRRRRGNERISATGLRL